MKKYLKNIIQRIVILILVIIVPVIVLELLLMFKENTSAWIEEDKNINDMNKQKLINSEYTTNGLWLHKNEQLSPKEEGKKRILIVGDSLIWGHGYSNANHIWWKQFKLMLEQKGYDDVEIVAAGVCGYNTEMQLNYILKDKELIEKVDPDLIIIGYVNNDPMLNPEMEKLILNVSDINQRANLTSLSFIKATIPNTYVKLSSLLADKFASNEEFEELFGMHYYNWLDYITSGENLEYYENEVIKPLKEYIENDLNIPYMFYITTPDSEEPGIDRIMKMIRKNGIACYFFPSYANKIGVNLKFMNKNINPVNSHPSVQLAKLYAESLVDIMEKDYLEILGKNDGEYVEKITINDWMPFSLLPQKTSENTYEITYPSKDAELSFLKLPVNCEYVKLNLEYPVKLNKISITGENIVSIKLWINTINEELGYDDQNMISLGNKKEGYIWNLDSKYIVTSINISADIVDGKEQKINIIVE